jgi:hypothetical protein
MVCAASFPAYLDFLTNIYANIKTLSVKQRPKGQKMTESQNSCAPGVEGEQGEKDRETF